jgi:large subunit ribosomal protein L24
MDTRKRFKIHIKKGDQVVVTEGDYKGKKGRVLQVFPSKYVALVEGVNIIKKHQKPTNNVKGGIIEKEAPVQISNIMLADPKTGEATRIGRKIVDGKLQRYSKKTGEIIK